MTTEVSATWDIIAEYGRSESSKSWLWRMCFQIKESSLQTQRYKQFYFLFFIFLKNILSLFDFLAVMDDGHGPKEPVFWARSELVLWAFDSKNHMHIQTHVFYSMHPYFESIMRKYISKSVAFSYHLKNYFWKILKKLYCSEINFQKGIETLFFLFSFFD